MTFEAAAHDLILKASSAVCLAWLLSFCLAPSRTLMGRLCGRTQMPLMHDFCLAQVFNHLPD